MRTISMIFLCSLVFIHSAWGLDYGDILQLGSSYRILIHYPLDYNKAVFINARGEYASPPFDTLKEAEEYSKGNNMFQARMQRLSNLNQLLPILSNETLTQDFGSTILKLYSVEIAKIGLDKNLHFLFNAALAELSDTDGTEVIMASMERLTEALKVSVLKEMTDQGIIRDDRNVIQFLGRIDAVKRNYIEMGQIIKKTKLDTGDLYADLIGMYIGSSLLTLYQLNYDYGKPPEEPYRRTRHEGPIIQESMSQRPQSAIHPQRIPPPRNDLPVDERTVHDKSPP
ncbi:MAG TPA: hypothetical protein DCZ95_07820 [Verrucomicrobia bacterium]|nr:MAG: hypothetical protein A2X46_00995 [Lentisphaerae bacterium GWF2_57_35]HBA83983.1 hypothetical protein [Verrucomicrobiota bacterium]